MEKPAKLDIAAEAARLTAACPAFRKAYAKGQAAMDPESDPRVKALGDYVRETHMLWNVFERAVTAELKAINTDQKLANPEKEFNVDYLRAVCSGRETTDLDRCRQSGK